MEVIEVTDRMEVMEVMDLGSFMLIREHKSWKIEENRVNICKEIKNMRK
jgi:hypothetical protein